MPELLLGVDGGGSHTVALVADRNGTMLGRGEAASSNHQSVGFPAAVAAIDRATQSALEQAGYDATSPITSACFGLAGAARPTDRARFGAWLVEQARIGRWRIVTDAELVLAAGTPAGWGVALISGTGSICYGCSADGRTARAGGWGYLMGDEGSGYALGVGALRLATQTADGRADAGRILRAILDYWRLREASELIAHVYHPARTRADIALLAQPIASLADRGDPSAQELMAQAARELARLVDAVVHTLGLHEPPVALGGGLLGARPRLQRGVVAQAAVPLGTYTCVAEPARGAVILARHMSPNTNDPQPGGT